MGLTQRRSCQPVADVNLGSSVYVKIRILLVPLFGMLMFLMPPCRSCVQWTEEQPFCENPLTPRDKERNSITPMDNPHTKTLQPFHVLHISCRMYNSDYLSFCAPNS